jgi:L-ascorbate metabolism protein UlaG (beta-lactamase superfamily)
MGEALQIASRTRAWWPAIHECSLWLGPNCSADADHIIGMNKGGTVEVEGLKVSMTAADHSAGDWNPNDGVPLYLGEPVGFVVEVENGFRFYHAGDTAAFGDMRLIGELHKPDLAILPIGGHYTMDPRGAALAVEMLGVRDVLPIHYGTFPALAGTPDELRAALAARSLSDVRVHTLEPGGTLT